MNPSPQASEEPVPDGAQRGTFLQRLHFVWFCVVAIIATLPAALTQVISHTFVPTDRNFKRWAGLWGRSILTGSGIRVDVDVQTKLDPDQSYVFISNHQNLIDILALAGYLPHSFGFVAKKELAKVPFLGLAIRQSASIFLDRSEPRKAVQSLQRAGEQIRRGMSVLLFAEGTRSDSWRRKSWQKCHSSALQFGNPHPSFSTEVSRAKPSRVCSAPASKSAVACRCCSSQRGRVRTARIFNR